MNQPLRREKNSKPKRIQLTLVIFDFPGSEVVSLVLPLLELWERVETEGLLVRLSHLSRKGKKLHKTKFTLTMGADELLQEGKLEQTGPVVVDEVNHQTLDVGAVLVLVSHDHDLAIAEQLDIIHRLIFLLILKTHDLD